MSEDEARREGVATETQIARVSPNLPTDMPEGVSTARHANARKAWDETLRQPLGLAGSATGLPENWFLGPKAENLDLMRALVVEVLDSHAEFRRAFHPEDPSHITPAIRRSPAFPGRGGASARATGRAARQA